MLNERKVLILEAEFLIALDLQRVLETMGTYQVLLAANAAEARSFSATWPELTLALVDRRNDDTDIGAIVAELRSLGVPLVQTTSSSLLAGKSDTPMLVKPVPEEELTSAIATALAEKA